MVMGSSNLMMGLTLVLVICLAVVLALVLILLAELYCSVLLRRRHTTQEPPITAVDNTTTTTHNDPLPSLTNLYTQSVLSAPRNILYPSVAGDDVEKQQSQVQKNQNSPENQENFQDLDQLVYISNPVFDGDENGRLSCRVAGNTPFETPDTSPSRLETEEMTSSDDGGGGGGGGEDGDGEMTSRKMVVLSPELSPVKKVVAPPSAAEDGGGGGDWNSSNNVVSSSSSSGTPCTSLSW